MPPMTRNLTCLTLATLMVAGQLTPAPLMAKPAASKSEAAPENSAGWMRPDPKMDRFIAELIAEVSLNHPRRRTGPPVCRRSRSR